MAPRLTWTLLWAFSVMLGVAPVARAQDPEVNYSRFSVFRIPFQTDPNGKLNQIQLYVSQDQGKTWQVVVTVSPEQRYFDFRAQQDGLYWFSVRTLAKDGTAFPATMAQARPGLKVYVDTQPPVIRLRALPSQGGEVGAEWEIRDDNLDSASSRLDYHLVGSPDWIPISADVAATGHSSWRPATNGPVEVRLRARDRADNWTEEKITINGGASGGSTGNASQNTLGSHDSGGAQPSEAKIRYVNSKRFGVNYAVQEQGRSGISTIELWYTQDPNGRAWQRYRVEGSPGTPPKPPFMVDVTGEGLYGLTLVVRSGVGLGGRPPQVGDAPQTWVEVDLTRPVVKLLRAEPGQGSDLGRLTIQWTASDKNLAKEPISLSYAEQASGEWKPIASHLENTGRYVWQMPTDVPFKFFVRVEATDKAKNVGKDESASPIIVDLAQPKGVILNVEPVVKTPDSP